MSLVVVVVDVLSGLPSFPIYTAVFTLCRRSLLLNNNRQLICMEREREREKRERLICAFALLEWRR